MRCEVEFRSTFRLLDSTICQSESYVVQKFNLSKRDLIAGLLYISAAHQMHCNCIFFCIIYNTNTITYVLYIMQIQTQILQAGPHSRASLHIYRSLRALQTSSGMQLQMFSAGFNLCDRAEQVHSQVWLIVEVFKKTVKIIGRN